MGTYLNPGNRGFQEILQSEYVDKTGLIALVNKTVGTMEKLSCISRPRRFGKSYAAKMLCAYYDCSCDSRELFDNKEIAVTEGYLAHLNQYHVINLDQKLSRSIEGFWRRDCDGRNQLRCADKGA